MSSTNPTRAAPACAERDPLEACHAGWPDTSIVTPTKAKSQARLNAEADFVKIWRRPVEVVCLPRRLVGRRHQ